MRRNRDSLKAPRPYRDENAGQVDRAPRGSRRDTAVISLAGWRRLVIEIARPLFPAGYALVQRRHSTRRDAEYSAGPIDQLLAYESRVYSQQGEDGILKEIFFRIGQGKRYFVEIGVEDGSICNTALLAHRYGWGGLLIEADPTSASALRGRWRDRPDILVRQLFVSATNVNDALREAGVPDEPDLLSIDIDGNDYWIWKALESYRPRVVVIEYNAAYPPPRQWIMAYNALHQWDGTTYMGASLESYRRLGERLGYALIGSESRGLNAFFLRRDILAGSGFVEASAQQAYNRPRYGTLRIPFVYRDGPSVVDG